MRDFEKAMRDPAGVYKSPENVLKDETLTKEQKIKILRQWEYDARDLMVAEEENMPGGEENMLNRVLEALHQLGACHDVDHTPPTKHGGE